MKKVIFIIGLPGSGKSWYADKKFKNRDPYKIFEEYQQNNIGSSRHFNKSLNFNKVIRLLRQDKIPVIIDIQFCDKTWRTDALVILKKCFHDISIEWICFTNEPKQCKKNVIKRRQKEGKPNTHEIDTIDEYSLKYTVPVGAKIIEVFKG